MPDTPYYAAAAASHALPRHYLRCAAFDAARRAAMMRRC